MTLCRLSLRALYLAHLEAWREEVRVQEEREAREREEEAQGELDLRLHLHRPRQTRITQDIHSVRAGEVPSLVGSTPPLPPQLSWRLTETE